MSGFGGPVSRKSEQKRIFAFSKRGERTGFDDKFRLGGAAHPISLPAIARELFALTGHPRMLFPPDGRNGARWCRLTRRLRPPLPNGSKPP
jgi:hypothetical protein